MGLLKHTKTSTVIMLALLAITLSLTPAFSMSENTKNNNHIPTFSIPENAKQIGLGVYDIGYKVHDGQVMQGTLYVFSDTQFAKPDGTPGNGPDKGNKGGSDTSTCYSYITKGAKWHVAEPWGVSSTGLAVPDATSILINAVNQWESADDPANVIMGDYDPNMVVDATTIGISMNDQNEVTFGDIEEDGVIAATWVWRTTAGPPSQRYIAEWDQVYDTVSFNWSNTGDPNSMDFDNIATHEIGHALGMGHPESTCTLETMYAYASNGETIKRDLHDGDIAGVNKLY